MAHIRRNVWQLGTAAKPWHDTLLWYARAVRVMQARPLSDPTSWRYQAAIHGLAGMVPPTGAPWNECQHSTWFFLPWHRMYLAQFELIVRRAVVEAGGPGDWTLPYWDYSGAPPANSLPPAFRAATLPDGTANPLFVTQRRASVNSGTGLPPTVTSSTDAMAATVFQSPSVGPPGFGGPRTGFAHFGPAPGLLENQPHNVVHVAVGGPSGLMTDPDTAALDPIFWLHHANIDRLWETWRLGGGANPTTSGWGAKTFRLRSATGATVVMRPRDVADTTRLDYTYDSLPAVAAVPAGGPTVPARAKPVMIGRHPDGVRVEAAGASAEVPLGAMAPQRAAASGAAGPSFHLELADIDGSANPGVVYGVYVGLPERPTPADLEAHRVGLVSFFGIEHSRSETRTVGPAPQRYVFDITGPMATVLARGDGASTVHVQLLPIEGTDDEQPAAAAAAPLRVGTIAIHQS